MVVIGVSLGLRPICSCGFEFEGGDGNGVEIIVVKGACLGMVPMSSTVILVWRDGRGRESTR